MRFLEAVVLSADEVEALKLYEVDSFEQFEAGKKMGVSQPTFARLLDKAQKKVAKAIIEGKAIRIEGRNAISQK